MIWFLIIPAGIVLLTTLASVIMALYGSAVVKHESYRRLKRESSQDSAIHSDELEMAANSRDLHALAMQILSNDPDQVRERDNTAEPTFATPRTTGSFSIISSLHPTTYSKKPSQR